MVSSLNIQNIYQPYITRPSFDDLNPSKNNQGLSFCPLMVTLTVQNIYQPNITRPSFDDLNPNENNQGL